ncbi:response regulator transcription factor [Blautia producta]|nr:response regulator transcription factor [Blautia producta]NSG14994.1 response regulator transcription factor [Blautia producta]NSJ75186.1 response regulator transcription factor [Blautia producta]
MLNIAICDDDIQTTGQLEMLIQNIAKKNFIDADIEVFWNGESLTDAVVAGDSFDIIYLDIEMDKEDGISAAKKIRIYDKNVLIIYVTSHENHMKESFAVRPFQFLVKPVNENQMEACFKAAYEDICSGDFYFRYSYQRMNHKVLIRDILYFESNKRKVFIVTGEETFELYGKLNEIENSLKACKVSFLRVHQSFLVNYKHVKGQSYDFVVMDNGKKISISEDRRKMISEQYCSMEDTYYVDE